MIKPPANVVRQGGIRHHLGRVEKKIVVIEHVLRLLGFDIGREKLLQLFVAIACLEAVRMTNYPPSCLR